MEWSARDDDNDDGYVHIRTYIYMYVQYYSTQLAAR